MELTTELVPTADLHPHPDNPRNGDIEAIAESLQVNGQYRPIVVAGDGTVLAGNHTYAAALSLGWERIYVVTLPLDPDSPEARRVMLADNRTADLGRYDDSALLGLLRDLDGLEGTGWTQNDADAIDALLHTESYLDSDEHHDRITEAVQQKLRRIVVEGLTADEFDRWRALPGADDRARLLGLMG